jgi:predicted lipoprotein with Yx(FWY)xxD motif
MRSSPRPALLVLTLVFAALVTAAAAQSPVRVASSPTLGYYLADADGMALYVYARDTAGVSNCAGQCAANWPPVMVDAAALAAISGIAGEFGTTMRAEGGTQLTYNGWPLYRWVRDTAAGETTGQAVNNVWWIANVNPIVTTVRGPARHPVLAGPNGKTVYLFTLDANGLSNCEGACAINWPPVLVGFDADGGWLPLGGEGVTGTLGYTIRDDGTRQLTIDNFPLYYWRNDMAPGDTTGHGIRGTWFTVPAEATIRDALRH